MTPYEVLGVDKNVSQAEIKKAYKKLAKQYHPDTTETADADKFKEVAEAYDKIGNAEKRKHYDTYGDSRRAQRSHHTFYGDMDSIFDELFNPGRKKTSRGDHIQVVVKCELEDVLTGCTKEVEYMRKEICTTCDGTGAKTKEKCKNCDGSGVALLTSGNMMVRTTCTKCGGKGEVILEPCENCGGVGLIGKRHQTLNVKIPAGIESGMRLSFAGMGEPAPENGISGNLYVVVDIAEHAFFERHNYGNLVCTVPVSYTELVTGAKIKFVTLDGNLGEFEIPAGSQSDFKFRLAGKGLPIAGTNRYGDVIITLDIEVPKNLDTEYQEVISKLAEKEAKYITERREAYGKYLADKKRDT